MLKGLKRLFLIGLGLFLLLIALVFVSLVRFEIDLTLLAWAAAIIMTLYIIGAALAYHRQPIRVVHIKTKVEFSSPPRLLKPVRNYKLKLIITKSIEEKGLNREVVMDELLMSFNESDHPDVYQYCMGVIRHQVDRSLNQVQLSYPKATVVADPLALPPAIKLLEE